jgi:tripartite-type tricarboxylate transporter receptor subunit TctC
MSFTLNRRHFIAAGSAATLLPLAGERADAQGAYPNKPIKIVVGYPAGGQTDIIARTYGDYVSKQLGQPVVVDNKSGASGIVGALEVKRSPADGYTLMCTLSSALIHNRVTVKNLPYDPDKDFTLISAITQAGLVMAASQKSGVTNLKEFVEYAKKNKVSGGTYAAGSTAHLILAELNRQYGLSIEPVHYRGETPMWADLASQSIDVAIGSYNASLGVIQTDRGKAIATTGLTRLNPLPNLPTLVEQGAQSKLYELRGFTCFGAPAGTPADIIKKLSDTIVAAGKDAKVQETFATFQLDPPIGAEEAQKLFVEQTPHWVNFMQAIGIKPD